MWSIPPPSLKILRLPILDLWLLTPPGRPPLRMRLQPLRMRRITWPVHTGKFSPHIWNPWPRFVSTLCNHYGSMIKTNPVIRQRSVVLCATEIQCRLYRLTVTRFLHSVLSMPCCSGRHDVQQTQITDHVNQNSFLIYAYFLSFITDHFNSVGGAIGHNSVCLCVAVSVFEGHSSRSQKDKCCWSGRCVIFRCLCFACQNVHRSHACSLLSY